jgi:SAM-dependent methyltransferase
MTSRTTEDRKKWEELYATGDRPDRPPSAWVVDTMRHLPNDGLVADIAGGSGRHARIVASPNRPVVLADFVLDAVRRARAANTAIEGVVTDVTMLPFRAGSFGTVLVTYFLNRLLFADLIGLLAPNGYLVYETYTLDHLNLVERGLARGPQTAEFLLRPKELLDLVKPLEVVEYWEGEVNDEAGRRCCACLVARSEERRASRNPR